MLMIAERSQRDPKEYLPFISHLRTLSLPLAKYTIDEVLKNWKNAITNLSQAGMH